MIVNPDIVLENFNERLIDALAREKFNRCKKYNNTPSNIGNTRRFYFNHNGKNIFVCFPKILFENLLLLMWDIAKKSENEKKEAIDLLKQAYEDKGFKSIIKDYSWSTSFHDFYKILLEESFLFFDDLSNQYYFNLFRKINSNEFTGGFLHTLTRHFKDFCKYNPSSNDTVIFDYGSFIVNLIICCIDGETEKSNRKTNNENDEIIIKRIPLDSKKLKVVLYWENNKKLFFLNTAYIESK